MLGIFNPYRCRIYKLVFCPYNFHIFRLSQPGKEEVDVYCFSPSIVQINLCIFYHDPFKSHFAINGSSCMELYINHCAKHITITECAAELLSFRFPSFILECNFHGRFRERPHVGKGIRQTRLERKGSRWQWGWFLWGDRTESCAMYISFSKNKLCKKIFVILLFHRVTLLFLVELNTCEGVFSI